MLIMTTNLDYLTIYDPIYGYMKFSTYASKIIDRPEFQRLRYLKQLGTANIAFPSATHTRFEHSLGTYYLVGLFLTNLFSNSPKAEIYAGLDTIQLLNKYKLNADLTSDAEPAYDLESISELVKIAGLCHDIGHGPFSHLFDDHFLYGETTPIAKHEYRSTYLVEYIIRNEPTLSERFDDSDIKFIKSLIDPSESDNGFIHQIVSNPVNSIDMDKFDYLTRDAYFLGINLGFESTDLNNLITKATVINNNIVYHYDSFDSIVKLFQARKNLHKIVVNHPTIIASQILITDMLFELDGCIDIRKNLTDIDFFCNLTDEFVINFVPCVKLLISDYKLNDRFIELHTNLTNHKYLKSTYIVNTRDIIDDKMLEKIGFDSSKHTLYVATYGFSNSPHNPLNNINLYKHIDMKYQIVSNDYKFDQKHQSNVYIIYDKK